MNKTTGFILLLIIALLGTSWFLIGGTLGSGHVSLTQAEYLRLQALDERFSKLIELEATIREHYYLPADDIDFDTALYRGLFHALGDKYSTYFTTDEYDKYQDGLSGEFVGIGITIEKLDDGQLRVVSPIPDSPAGRAGIQTGDIITLVDDTEVQSLTLDESVALMRGTPGTKVTLVIRRAETEIQFSLTRAKIISPTVEWEVRDGDVGYLRIKHFETHADQQFRNGLQELMNQGVTSLIIDVRNNPGGYLKVAVDMADQLLGEQTIVTVMTPNQSPEVYRSRPGKLDLPYVMLVNQGSASASEILAGAVQDSGSGLILGEITTGKGLVQNSYRLNDGSGFRLTTAYYLTPNGNNIHLKGIIPDINHDLMAQAGYEYVVETTIGSTDDAVLRYAIDYLKGRLPSATK